MSDNCGTPWSQTFSFDPFGNVSKSGSITFQPGYNSPKNQYTGVTYDADGEPSNDGFFSYTWDLYGGVKTIGTLTEVHDALGRIVEQQGSTNTELIYAPDGQKLALMTGQTLSKA